MNRSDADIRHDVESELQWNPSIDDQRIGVLVSQGIVTLTGEVTHLAGRFAAEEITKRVKGVRAIANEITVNIPVSGIQSDTDIAGAAAEALKWNVMTAGTNITPVVKDGCVTLCGQVTFGFQKFAAERAVKHLLGVRSVLNNLLVSSASMATRVKHDIGAAIGRHHRHDAEAVDAKVEDTSNLPSGTVHSLQAESAAVAARPVSPESKPCRESSSGSLMDHFRGAG